MSRRAALVVLVTGAVLALPSIAWAHGQLRPGRAAAGASVQAVLVVPSERQGHGNDRVALAVPPDFRPEDCRAPTGWTCTTSGKGFTWQRGSGDLVEEFALTMRVGGRSGTYLLPLAQTYDDGEARRFAGDPGRRDEGPTFTVTSGSTGGSPRATAPGGPALAGLPPGRRLEPPASDGGSALLVAVGVVALTALAGTVLALRRRRGDDDGVKGSASA